MLFRPRRALGLCLLLVVAACNADLHTQPDQPGSDELAYRRSLGIPDEAETVVVYSQSSHLDINWLMTFEEYQDRIVDYIITNSLDLLDHDPRAVYSMAEMGFLRVWWERYPEHRDRLRRHVAAGRFRIVGGAVTTPDTNLPPSESIIRDYVEGIRWIEAAAGATVSTAWIPDSFGHSPLTPDLLAGLGMSAVGFSRLDGGPGMPFKIPEGLERHFNTYEIVAGTHAAALREAGSQSFRWLGAGGAEVLGMYMPYTYCQGDTLGSLWPLNPPGIPLTFADETPRIVEAMERYHEQLAPFGETGYLFVPVGCDFQPPKERLTRYVDDWNRVRYEETGVWALRASFEEYAKLVSFRRAKLPEIPMDGNPVWTGYFGERPRIKQLSFLGTAWLTAHELLSVLTGAALPARLADWWWMQALSNHHDWIPGTSPDRVYLTDQVNLSEAMVAEARQALEERLVSLGENVASPDPVIVALNSAGIRQTAHFHVPLRGLPLVPPVHGELPDGSRVPVSLHGKADARWAELTIALPSLGYTTVRMRPGAWNHQTPLTLSLYDDLEAPVTNVADAAVAVLSRPELSVTLRRDVNWAVTSVRGADGEEWLAGPSDQWVVYHDLGGMYQIGSERGCSYEPLPGLPAPFQLAASESTGERVTLHFETDLYGAPATRTVTLTRNGPVKFESTLRAPEWTTVVARFQTAIVNGEHRNGIGYGSVTRPYGHLYSPSYWPATWSGLFGSPLGVIVSRPETTGFAAGADGQIELFLKRNAYEEQCAGLGAAGNDHAYDTLQFALHTFAEDQRSGAMAEAQATTLPPIAVFAQGGAGEEALTQHAVESHTPGIMPAAVHPREGKGFVFRVIRLDDEIENATLSLGKGHTLVTPVNLRGEPLSTESVELETVDTGPRVQSFAVE